MVFTRGLNATVATEVLDVCVCVCLSAQDLLRCAELESGLRGSKPKIIEM